MKNEDMRKLIEAVDLDEGVTLHTKYMNLRAALEHVTMLTVYKASDENVLHEINEYARNALDNN